VVAAAVVAAAVTCAGRPELGSVAFVRSGALRVVDLGSCRERVVVRHGVRGPVRFAGGAVVFGAAARRRAFPSPDGRSTAFVRVTRQSQTIVVRGSSGTHPVVSVSQVYKVVNDDQGPIWLFGWSPDSRWLLFTIDPDSSGSIAADGLRLRIVSASGGKPISIAKMLPYADYMTWCGKRLVFTAGIDRVATHRKKLDVASAPDWRPQLLVRAPARAWGSLACAPDGRSVVVQSAPASADGNFFAARWALWRVGLDGSLRRLTTPPPGYADDSPRWSRNGKAILFVRSHRGSGKLYLWSGGRVTGPLASVGYRLGYYGHRNWWAGADWSFGR
jgi:WD40-like Beta Propeller Repeat